MAEIKTAVVKHCTLNTGILAAFANRITPDKVPDNQAYPHARVLNITNDQRYHQKGESGRKSLVQIDVYDDDLVGADANAELIRIAFSGYRGVIGNTVNAGMVKANLVSGSWNEEARNFHRILELEILTND